MMILFLRLHPPILPDEKRLGKLIFPSLYDFNFIKIQQKVISKEDEG